MHENSTPQTPLRLMLEELKVKLEKALCKKLEIHFLPFGMPDVFYDDQSFFNKNNVKGPFYYIGEPVKEKFLFIFTVTSYRTYFAIELGIKGKGGGRKQISCWAYDSLVREISMVEVEKYSNIIKATEVCMN